MDITWLERLSLFRYALLAALAAGLVCPLLGALLWLRRTGFYGITLPQFSAAGVVLGYACLAWWIDHFGLGELTLDQALGDPHAIMNYLLAWAALACGLGLGVLVWLGRAGHDGEAGRVAAAFAIANAATYLFGRMSPVGSSHVSELLQGEILGVGRHELETVAGVMLLVLGVLLWRRREVVLVSFDPEFARVLGLRRTRIELLLLCLCTATVACGTMILGPTVLFGLIVLPALAARPFARSMDGFFVLSSLAGFLSVLLGVVLSFEADLPLGASVVAGAALLLLPGLARRLARR
jgi:ABC-type Mn2+/Zn2+ transport system permease subunit